MRSKTATRDYLLDVAIAEFARKGFEKTSLRSIAKTAEVSPALLIHYFASRDQLVAEAIGQTLGVWVGQEKKALLENSETRLSDWVELVRSGETRLAFMRQVLLANNHHSRALFDAALTETRQMIAMAVKLKKMKSAEDVETTALLMTSQALANIVFLEQIEAGLGGSIATETNALKILNAQSKLLNLQIELGKEKK